MSILADTLRELIDQIPPTWRGCGIVIVDDLIVFQGIDADIAGEKEQIAMSMGFSLQQEVHMNQQLSGRTLE